MAFYKDYKGQAWLLPPSIRDLMRLSDRYWKVNNF
jgi:hypothetical protein